MPQQINLCTPVLLTQQRYFSARTMLQALALFVVGGVGLAAYGVSSLNSAARVLRATVDAQAPELASLRSALEKNRNVPGAGAPALTLELQAARAQLLERQKTLLELRRGLMPPGLGHSARLQLVAQSIPAQVWVTQMVADQSQLVVQGFTVEPAALNDWVAKLAQSPLLAGQGLAQVKVERVTAQPESLARNDVALAPVAGPGVAPARAIWSFSLTTSLAWPDDPAVGSRP